MTASVTYRAVLDVRRQTVIFLSSLLHARRQVLGTRTRTRSLGCSAQAVLVLRWFLDGSRVAQLAVDNAIGGSTAYRYLHEGIDVLAERKPSLHAALLATKIAGHTHINLDGTLLATDRCHAPSPTPGADLWWSGKHHHHGGNVQVVSTPDGWPIWTSEGRPGREHDTTCLRKHDEMLPALRQWTGDHLPALADLGYEGEDVFIVPIKKPAGGKLTDDQRQLNWLHRTPGPAPNRPTPCSRPPSRRCGGSACHPSTSARSSLRPWSCCTSNTIEPHDDGQSRTVTGNGSLTGHPALSPSGKRFSASTAA